MIRLPTILLPEDTDVSLNSLQAVVDAESTYKRRVAKAKSYFKAKNTASDPVFKVIRQKLSDMCPGARRCCYCEDSCADEVEHIAPKDLYPDKCFVWDNYLYACGPCNGPKNNQYQIFRSGSDSPLDVTRKRDAPVVPPPDGEAVLINPRNENPLDYIWLDMETFRFVPDPELVENSRPWIRADYTINTILRLNEREVLVKAREAVYYAYLALLRAYISDRENGCDEETLILQKEAIQSLPHPTVWQEMKRQRQFYATLREIFSFVPEALGW
jgi:hypothetical protein